MTIHIAICEDEPAQADYLDAVVHQWVEKSGTASDVHLYESAEAFLFDYDEQSGFDILLLDIQMRGMSGIELAKRIRKTDMRLQIIFITAVSAFASVGYDVSALHYLVKPIDEGKLFIVLSKACDNIKKEDRCIAIWDTEGDTIRLSTSGILYAESFGHYTEIVMIKETVKTRMPIKEIEFVLGDGFVRCHRCYIAGIRNVKRISGSEIVFDNGKIIPLSRRLHDVVNRCFIDYFKG